MAKKKTKKAPKPAPTPDCKVMDVHLRVTVSSPKFGSRRGPGAGIKFDLVREPAFWERVLYPARATAGYSDPMLTLVGLGEVKEVDEFSEEVGS